MCAGGDSKDTEALIWSVGVIVVIYTVSMEVLGYGSFKYKGGFSYKLNQLCSAPSAKPIISVTNGLDKNAFTFSIFSPPFA